MIIVLICTVIVQMLSRVWLFANTWTATRQVSLSFTISQSLFKLMFIELMMPSNRLIFCCPLLLLPSIFPSIGVFFSESACHIRWPKYWCFSISPSNEYSWLIFFSMDWFDLLAVQGTLRVFSSTIIRKPHFFGAQPSLWSNSHICNCPLVTPSRSLLVTDCWWKHLPSHLGFLSHP